MEEEIFTSNIDISIVIINYNTFDLTCNCIKSIISETKDVSYEIILVDNKSTKDNPARFKEIFPSINLILSPENLGFSCGNNLGIKAARGEYILLLNSDTIILDNAIYKSFIFFKSLESSPDKIGIVACKLLNEDLSFQATTSAKEPEKYSFASLAWTVLKENNPFIFHLEKFIAKNFPIYAPWDYSYVDDIYFTAYVSGAFMLLKKEMLQEVGSLDNDFFMYYEEVEWFYRIRKAGYKIVYYPLTKIIHLAGSSGGKDKMFRQQILSKTLWFYKLEGIKGFLVITLINIINAITNVMAAPFIGKNSRKIALAFSKKFILAIPQIWSIPFKRKQSVSEEWQPLKANDL